MDSDALPKVWSFLGFGRTTNVPVQHDSVVVSKDKQKLSSDRRQDSQRGSNGSQQVWELTT